MPSLFVTGAAGFIGSNFVRHWVDRHAGDRVIAFDLPSMPARCEN